MVLKKRCQKMNSIINELRQRLSVYEPQVIYQQFEVPLHDEGSYNSQQNQPDLRSVKIEQSKQTPKSI